MALRPKVRTSAAVFVLLLALAPCIRTGAKTGGERQKPAFTLFAAAVTFGVGHLIGVSVAG